MRDYTDAELETLLADIESELSERKESLQGDAPTKIREAICAFANDLPDRRRPGVVFVGIRDDGAPSGIEISDRLLLTLADMKSDGNIVPPPTLTVEKRRLAGAEVAVIIVQPADSPPVRFRGRVHNRVGPRRGTASSQHERILSEKRRHRDRPFDVQPVPSADVRDLSRAFFDEVYLPSAVAPDVLEANDRTYEQRLAATKMLVSTDDPTPTVMGVLVLGRQPRDFVPGAYVQFLRVAGHTLADAITDEHLIAGTVSDVIRRADDKLAAHNTIAVDITGGPRERRFPTYPMPALQQYLRNAIMHRAYDQTNAPVRITWYTDRIEIISPGGPFGLVSISNFGQPGLADYRNPNLAEAMRVLGHVQRFGAGLSLARRELAKNGNPEPQFDIESTHVRVTVYSAV
jgi:ATP-dependent DNA helicase RecG